MEKKIPKLQNGDIVCVTYRMADDPDENKYFQALLSYGIRKTQCFNDVDGKATFTHTFIIVDAKKATTFEALWTYKHQRMFDVYAGQEVIIGRNKNLDPKKFRTAYNELSKKYTGKRYPVWKFPVFLFTPRLLKYLPGKPVCSEHALLHWYEAGAINHWKGVTPSYVADMIRRWETVEQIYQGRLPK